MHWELWDTEVGALVETFPSEAEALRGVREILAVNSPDLVNALVLGAMYDEEEPRDRELPPVLGGKELLSYLATTPESPVVTAAALVVHERIRQWLAEENWDVRKVDDPQSSFNVMATLPSGPNVNIFHL